MDKTTFNLLKAAVRVWRVMDVNKSNAPEIEELFDALFSFPEAIIDEVMADIKKDEGGE